MDRRKRVRSDENDDSIERRFFDKGKIDFDGGEEQTQTSSKEPSAEEIERRRSKKKAKKQRQKEKKTKIITQRQEANEADRNRQEEMKLLKEVKKKRKEIEKKAPPAREFIKTHKGVKYCDVLLGKGHVIEYRKNVRVKYVLRAKEKHGKVIDSSDDFGFKMGKGEVISGWEIGLQGMKQGGVRHITVPPQAGYGLTNNIGAGKGGLLYFEVTLLKC